MLKSSFSLIRLLRVPFGSASPAAQNRKKTPWHYVLCTTAWWLSASRAKRSQKAASSSPIPSRRSKIIAVGPGGRDETGKLTPLDVKAGDRILFGKWSGTEVKIDGDDLLIMKESDILGVVD